MKTVAFVPYWLDYRPNQKEHKNLKKLGGKYLINYTLRLLNKVPQIDQTYIYCSDTKVLDYLDGDTDYEYLQRPTSLDSENVAIEDIIDAFLAQVDADVVVLIHPNSPFLQPDTLSKCIDAVKFGGYDSALTAFRFQKLSWFDDKPLNYSLDKPIPKLSTITPVIFEQSSVYVFRRDAYNERRKRIGKNPFFNFIDHFEGHEVNTPDDYAIAELIVNSGMFWDV